MKAVVDTNITIAANGRNTHASFECQLKCIELLQDLISPGSSHRIFLDDQDLIMTEYHAHLNHKGAPGVGDRFYKFLHDHRYTSKNIAMVPITPLSDESRGFAELPQNPIDKSDRKFLAVAIAAKATVLNALDTDWHQHKTFIQSLKIRVKQICPEHGCTA